MIIVRLGCTAGGLPSSSECWPWWLRYERWYGTWHHRREGGHRGSKLHLVNNRVDTADIYSRQVNQFAYVNAPIVINQISKASNICCGHTGAKTSEMCYKFCFFLRPPQKLLYHLCTCAFNNISLFSICVRSLRKISTVLTFLFERNLIIMRCATVPGIICSDIVATIAQTIMTSSRRRTDTPDFSLGVNTAASVNLYSLTKY